MPYVVAAILIVTALGLVAIYNRMVSLKVRAGNAWSDIDVQLKRRWDLVPALAAAVKGYAGHERELFEEVARERSAAMKAGAPAAKGAAEGTFAQGIGRLLAVVEQYPELKASANFLELQKQLVQVEETLQNARRYYNAVVRDYNTLIQQFPQILVARAGGFAGLEYFQLDSQEERQAVKVKVSEP